MFHIYKAFVIAENEDILGIGGVTYWNNFR